jgi:hypothetical protein
MSEIDLEASQERREWEREQVRLRAHLLSLLSTAPMDSELFKVTPYEVVDGSSGESA